RRAARYGSRTTTRSSDRIDHVIFDRSGATYGIELTALREIQIVDRFCAVPGASPVAPGMVHFRGELLSLHDVAPYLAEDDELTSWRWLLIVEHDDRRLGLMADDVQGISTFNGDEIGEVPLALGEKAACFAGIAEGNRLLLDPSGLFETPTFYLATAAQENA
ncbi:MAG: chemotaxis protein CheW, partial [Myxococcota bacterium]